MMFKSFVLTTLCVMIIWISISLNPGSSQQVDFRVNNLENDLRRVDLRLQQIELILNRNNQLPSVNSPVINPNSRDIFKGNLSNYERDKILNKLSTLVVEVKQQVNQLKLRITKLEGKNKAE